MSDKKSLKIAKGGNQEPKIKQGQTTTVDWCMVFNATFSNISVIFGHCIVRGCRGRDRIVVGFTTTHAISAYHH
jgi:hypothetical protein